MTLNEYQTQAMTTCLPTSDNFSYMALNLVGEVGEFASKVAKAIRKEQLYIGLHQTENGARANDLMDISPNLPELAELRNELKKEAGDILWQLAGLCNVMGWSLEDVAHQNLNKLASRKQRGVIDGSGDNR